MQLRVMIVVFASLALAMSQEADPPPSPAASAGGEKPGEQALEMAVQQLKSRLTPEQLKTVTDDQLRQFIIQQAQDQAQAQGHPPPEAQAQAGHDHHHQQASPKPPPGLRSSPDARVGFLFPETVNNTFVAGVPVELLLTMSNGGKKPLALSTLFATLYHPQDYKYQILNFTRLNVNLTLAPGSDVSLTYTFTPDPYLEPRAFGLAVQILYTDGASNFSHTFFNDTVTIAEPPSSFDAQTVFVGMAVLGLLALGAYAFSGVFQKLRKTTKRGAAATRSTGATATATTTTTTATTAQAAAGMRIAPEQNEWLQGTSAVQHRKRH
jgi:hypothetical protein